MQNFIKFYLDFLNVKNIKIRVALLFLWKIYFHDVSIYRNIF